MHRVAIGNSRLVSVTDETVTFRYKDYRHGGGDKEMTLPGYPVVGQGHHQITFEALELAMGPSIAASAAYFDTCRRKRNLVEYDMANVTTDTEVEELLRQAGQFQQVVEAWIARQHPSLTP